MSEKQLNESIKNEKQLQESTEPITTSSNQVTQESIPSASTIKSDTKSQNTNKDKKPSNSTPKPRNRTINLKEIVKKEKQMDKMSTYILDRDYESNTNTIIKYYEKFSQERIDDLLQEAYKNLDYVKREKLPYFQGENQDVEFMSYIIFLISVRFTSLDKDVSTDFTNQVPIMASMYTTGLTDRIQNEVLPQEEIYRILEKLEQFTSMVNKISNLEESTRDEILSSVQNKEILNYTQPNTDVIHPLVNPETRLLQ